MESENKENKAAENNTENSGVDLTDRVIPDTQGKDVETKRTFTQEDVDKIIKERLERQERKFQQAQDEAEKLRKMDANQKSEYQREKLESERDDALAKLARFEMKEQASRMLADKGITADEALLNMVLGKDAEATKSAIDSLAKMIDVKVTEGVKAKLTGTPPKVNLTSAGGLTKEKIMSEKDSVKRIQMIQAHPELFR